MHSTTDTQQRIAAAHLEQTVYSALSGYLEKFAPTPDNMLGVDRSLAAEEWLAAARHRAEQLRELYDQDVQGAIDRMVRLVAEEKYATAQAFILAQAEATDEKIRAEGRQA